MAEQSWEQLRTTIAELPKATTLNTDDKIIVENDLQTQYATIAQLTDALVSGGTSSVSSYIQSTSLSVTVELADLQATIDALPKIINGANITIKVKPGTINTGITIQKFIGTGNMNINAIDASGNYVVTPSAMTHNISFIKTYANVFSRIAVQGFNCTLTTGNTFDINQHVGHLYIYMNSAIEGTNTDTANYGAYVLDSGDNIYFNNCMISNKRAAIYSHHTGNVSTNNLSGSDNYYIYVAINGGEVRVRSAGTITGTTTYYKSAAGTIVKSDGTFA